MSRRLTNKVSISHVRPSSLADNNFLRNGGFRVAQRGTSFDSTTTPANNDGNYLLDGWICLSDGNNVFDVSQNTTAADIAEGAYAGINLDVETEDLKGGILQIIQARDTARLFKQGNGKCSLSFSASTSDATNYTLIRGGVLAWDSTADIVTSDVVDGSNWNAEGTNPTLATNWTYENTPVALTALSETVQRYTIEDISLDTASTTNLAVFIWMEDKTNDVGDIVTISDAKLEPGPIASQFTGISYSKDLAWNKHYFHRIDNSDFSTASISAGYASATTGAQTGGIHFPVEMRINPSVSVSGTDHFDINARGSNIVVTSVGPFSNKWGTSFSSSVGSGLTLGDGIQLRFDGTAGRFMDFSSEL